MRAQEVFLSDLILRNTRCGFPHSFFGNGQVSLPSPRPTSALILVSGKSYFTCLATLSIGLTAFYRYHLDMVASEFPRLCSLPLPLSLLTLASWLMVMCPAFLSLLSRSRIVDGVLCWARWWFLGLLNLEGGIKTIRLLWISATKRGLLQGSSHPLQALAERPVVTCLQDFWANLF